jgi:predicted transcriptional regulator of viral defense system
VGRLIDKYGRKDSPHSVERVVAGLAARQHGVLATWQLAALGVPRHAVDALVRTRHLHRLYRAVYAVGHAAVSPRGRDLAAVLSCGPGALASHRLAGQLWGFVRTAKHREVTAPRSRAKRDGVLVHRSRRLTGHDRAVIDAVPVTVPARTLVDLADVLSQPRLADAVHEAEVIRVFDLGEIRRAQKRVPGRRGRHRLARALAAYEEQPMTRSMAERRSSR